MIPSPLKVVLLTRTQRPSGARMAQVLCARSVHLVGIVAERRSRLIFGKRGFLQGVKELVQRHGVAFLVRRGLEFLRGYGFRSAIATAAGQNHGRREHIQDVATQFQVPLFVVDDHNGGETQDILQRLRPDLIVLCNTRKISGEIFRIAPRGAVNLHLSLLPDYAGLDSIFWALFHQERQLGFSIHRVTAELDAGDLLYQEKMPLAGPGLPSETGLYEALIRRGCEAMARVVLDFDRFEACARRQDPGFIRYFSWPSGQQRKLYRRYRQELFHQEPLKVLHLITRMVRGGAQENTLATVLGLQAAGYHAVLATGPSEGPEGTMEEEMRRAGLSHALVRGLIRPVSLIRDIRTLLWLTWWMRREKFFIVHTHTSKAGLLGRLAARLAGVPFVVHTSHGHVFQGYFSRAATKAIITIEKFLARHTDRIVALTPRERQEHLELGIGTPDKFVTIPSGVPEGQFSLAGRNVQDIRRRLGIPQAAQVIGTVARLVPIKGVEYLLGAFRLLASQMPQAYCLICGDGPQMQSLKDLAGEYGISQRVLFTGYRHDVADMLSCMDVFVLASLNEGMGRVLVQAGLMSRPIVATATSGIRDLIREGRTGLLVPPGNSEELARAIRALLGNESLARRLGQNAREAFRVEYSEAQMVQSIRALYEEMIGQEAIPVSWLRPVDKAQEPIQESTNIAQGKTHEKLCCG